MGLFNKDKEYKKEIIFNRKAIQDKLAEISDTLHMYRNDEPMKIVMSLIKLGKNISILDASIANSEEARISVQAKVNAYSELQLFIETALERKVITSEEGKKTMKGAFNSIKRFSNQAGSSI